MCNFHLPRPTAHIPLSLFQPAAQKWSNLLCFATFFSPSQLLFVSIISFYLFFYLTFTFKKPSPPSALEPHRTPLCSDATLDYFLPLPNPISQQWSELLWPVAMLPIGPL